MHRDLKPENLRLRSDGTGKETIKIIDFGFACSDTLFQKDLAGTTE